MPRLRPFTATILRLNGEPWPNARIVIGRTESYENGAIFPADVLTFTADANGEISGELWADQDGEISATHYCQLPGRSRVMGDAEVTRGATRAFSLPYEDGSSLDLGFIFTNYASSADSNYTSISERLAALIGVTRIYPPYTDYSDAPAGAVRIALAYTTPAAPSNLQIEEGEDSLFATIDDPAIGTFTEIQWRLINTAPSDNDFVVLDWTSSDELAEYLFEDLVAATHRVDCRLKNGTAYGPTTSATATPTGPVDLVAPGVPTDLAVQISGDSNILTWNDPADSDLALIRIYQDGVLVDEVPAGVETFSADGFDDPTSASWTVAAVDTSGNASAQSGAVGGTPTAGVFFITAVPVANASVNNYSIAKPSSVIAGRFLLLEITVNDSVSAVIVPPVGWTQLGSQITGGNSRQAIFYRFVTSNTEGPYVFNWGVTTNASYVLSAWRGVHAVTPIEADTGGAFSAASGTTITMPDITTLTNKAVRVDLLSVLLEATTTPPAGTNEHFSEAKQSGGSGHRISVLGSETRPTAGATGTRNYTLSQSRGTIRRVISLKPAA